MRYKMNYMGGNETQVEGTHSKPVSQPIPVQDQSHLLALTSEWGHSVFEEKMKVEQEEQQQPRHTNVIQENHEVQDPKLSPGKNNFDYKDESGDQISESDSLVSTERKLRCCKRGRLTQEQILAKRASQAAAQREVRRRRKMKMSEDELEQQRAATAAAQREARKRQRERLSEEQLQIRKTLNAIAQKEVRQRKQQNMTPEELKAYRAREAARQKELRQRRRMAMTEEELKAVKAREAAASAARRARRLGKLECTECCSTGQCTPDPSPS